MEETRDQKKKNHKTAARGNLFHDFTRDHRFARKIITNQIFKKKKKKLLDCFSFFRAIARPAGSTILQFVENDVLLLLLLNATFLLSYGARNVCRDQPLKT